MKELWVKKETLELKLTRPREIFSIKPSPNLGLDSNRMIGLNSLEIYNFLFDKTEENNQFEIYTNNFHEFSFTERKDEFQEILSSSDFTTKHLQLEKIGPRNIKAYKKL